MTHFPTSIGAPVALSLFLAACTVPADPQVSRQQPIAATADAGPLTQARDGTCQGRDMTPAVVEVVTEQELLTPARVAADGTIIAPATYRTNTHQKIVSPRREVVFEVPCPDVFTPEFITSLQRALAARGVYNGRPSGVMDAPTRAAIRAWQKRAGLNSEILALETALGLGLVPYGRDQANL